jgi:hypothetical protein
MAAILKKSYLPLFGRWVAKLLGKWVARLVERVLATAAFWVRIQTSLKNTKLAKLAKEWPTLSSQLKIYRKQIQKKSSCGWIDSSLKTIK